MVENKEPDTINYQFYLNRGETKCMVHEHTKILRVYLLTLLVLHRKQYFQRFSITQN